MHERNEGREPFANEETNRDRLTPHEAKERLVAAHTREVSEGLKTSEVRRPPEVLSVLSADIRYTLYPLHYGKGNVPQFGTDMSFYLHDIVGNLEVRKGEEIEETLIMPPEGYGLITPHKVTEEDATKVAYRFGRTGLKPVEAAALIGDSFQEEAREAMTNELDVLGFGLVRHELLPGIALEVQVVGPDHWANRVPVYIEEMAGQTGEYKAAGSYGVVPLQGEYPLTAEGLLEKAKEAYVKDFRRRFTPVLHGASAREMKLFYDNPDESRLEGLTYTINRMREKQGLPILYDDHDVRGMLTDPSYMAEDAKLFLLAKAQSVLEVNGRTYAFTEEADLDQQLAVMGEEYTHLQHERAEKEKEKEQERLALLRRSMEQPKLPEMTEEEKHAIIERNLELLELKFVKNTPYWDLDKETNEALAAVNEGRSVRNPDDPKHIDTDIAISYDTATGAIGIGLNEELLPGGHSFLSTEMRRTRAERDSDNRYPSWESQRILVTLPGTGPTQSQIERALFGPYATIPEEDNRRILPQRIVPRSLPDEKGRIEVEYVREPWGESAFTPNVEGDSVLLRSVQLFNARHGAQG